MGSFPKIQSKSALLQFKLIFTLSVTAMIWTVRPRVRNLSPGWESGQSCTGSGKARELMPKEGSELNQSQGARIRKLLIKVGPGSKSQELQITVESRPETCGQEQMRG